MNDAVEPTLQKIETFIEGFFWMLPNLGIALVVFLLFCISAWAAKRAVKGVFHRRRREDLGNLLGGLAKWSLIVFGLLVVATIVFPSVSPASILSTLGIGSIAIGFAFKDILQNWLSGFLILYRQPFRTNDQIRSGEFEGTVEQIEARATLIRTYDGQRVVIPNADIYTRAVTVRTAFPKRRSEYTVGIGYGDDIDHACETILRAVEGVPGILKDPAPEALPWSLDSSTVNILVRWWTDSRRSNVVAAQARIIPAIKRALVEKGIDMPFPTQVVLFHDQTEETDGDRTRQREGWPAGANPPKARHLNEVEIERLASSRAQALAEKTDRRRRNSAPSNSSRPDSE
jgi:small-conductance mechanosensitive channel